MTPIIKFLTELSMKSSVRVVVLRGGIELETGRQPRVGEVIEVRGDVACNWLRGGAVDLVADNGFKISTSGKHTQPRMKRQTQ